jgi:alkanesulfonate monooxygenase SsuD/methylene tetrahydromethanopterin reductase-like flavin-dependent oxidoreductase (luciferase family)
MPDHPLHWWDSWTMLAGVAEATERIRLGTTVSWVYSRNPVQLALASQVMRSLLDGAA